MAQLNLNTRMCETGNEAFMLWTVNPSEVDIVMVITEGEATMAMDVKVAIMTNLQPLMVLTFRIPAIHL